MKKEEKKIERAIENEPVTNDTASSVSDELVSDDVASSVSNESTWVIPTVISPNQIEKVISLPFTGEVSLATFNGREFLDITMHNPFEGEPFGDVKLVFAKPDKTNNFGNFVPDNKGEERAGAFELLTKRALQSSPESKIAIAGDITYRRWTSKKGDDIDFVNINVLSPFGSIKGHDTLNAYLKNSRDKGAFELLAKERLKLCRVVK